MIVVVATAAVVMLDEVAMFDTAMLTVCCSKCMHAAMIYCCNKLCAVAKHLSEVNQFYVLAGMYSPCVIMQRCNIHCHTLQLAVCETALLDMLYSFRLPGNEDVTVQVAIVSLRGSTHIPSLRL